MTDDITSELQVANLAVSMVGKFIALNDIETPETDPEKLVALWYNVAIDATMRRAIPNFAMTRRLLVKSNYTPPFGYENAYAVPSDCIKVLGIGNIDDRTREYSLEADENDNLYILTDDDYPDGLPLRFIRRHRQVARWTPDFVILGAFVLSRYVGMQLTQDPQLVQSLRNEIAQAIAEFSGISAQENPPIRKSESKFRQARQGYLARGNHKK